LRLSRQRIDPQQYVSANNSLANPRQAEADSKLGRKGERPTVAQLLEIGVNPAASAWLDVD